MKTYLNKNYGLRQTFKKEAFSRLSHALRAKFGNESDESCFLLENVYFSKECHVDAIFVVQNNMFLIEFKQNNAQERDIITSDKIWTWPSGRRVYSDIYATPFDQHHNCRNILYGLMRKYNVWDIHTIAAFAYPVTLVDAPHGAHRNYKSYHWFHITDSTRIVDAIVRNMDDSQHFNMEGLRKFLRLDQFYKTDEPQRSWLTRFVSFIFSKIA